VEELTPTYIIGDIHGNLRTLHRILEQAHLIDHHHSWSGGQSHLWFMGDLVDRGRDNIEVIDFVMRLQGEAQAAGGFVGCLLGNHEVLFLGAYQFGRRSTGLSSNFITKWRRNGGQKDDLKKLTKQHIEWLTSLPPMARIDDTLLIHADSTFYTHYGNSIDEVNAKFLTILKKSNTLDWEEMIEEFASRSVFQNQMVGKEVADRFLMLYKCKRLIHGHTPISLFTGQSAKKVTEAFTYADGLCVNVDGGIYMGSPGFVYQLEAQLEPATKP
jgi:hypothetical protein